MPSKRAAIRVYFDVANTSKRRQRVMVDFCIHYVKANGSARPKVFKLKTVNLAPGESSRVEKKISVADMTTRRHYTGRHHVGSILNGHSESIGFFDLIRKEVNS